VVFTRKNPRPVLPPLMKDVFFPPSSFSPRAFWTRITFLASVRVPFFPPSAPRSRSHNFFHLEMTPLPVPGRFQVAETPNLPFSTSVALQHRHDLFMLILSFFLMPSLFGPRCQPCASAPFSSDIKRTAQKFLFYVAVFLIFPVRFRDGKLCLSFSALTRQKSRF